MKWTALQDHLMDTQRSDPIDRGDIQRLCLSYNTNQGGWRYVHSLIAGINRWKVDWCPDANIAIAPDRAATWDALRIAAFERGACTTLTGTVEGELQEWLEDPWRNRELADAINQGLRENTWIDRYVLPPNGAVTDALLAYTRLLGTRRFLTIPGETGLTPFGADGTNKSAVE